MGVTGMDTSARPVIRLVNPLGMRRVETATLARRLTSIDGMSIGIIDNHKHNADNFLTYIEEMIHANYSGVTMHRVRKNFSACYLIANELEGKVQAVVNAWGD